MKNLKYTLALAVMIMVSATSQLQAQEVSGGAVIKKGQDKVQQEADKAKAAAADREAKIRAQKERVSNETGGIKDPKPTLTSGTKKVGQEVVDIDRKRKAIMEDYNKSIENASTEAEKAKLRKEAKQRIAELTGSVKDKTKKEMDSKMESTTDKASTLKDQASTTTNNVKSETEKATRVVTENKDKVTGVVTTKARIVKMDKVKTDLSNKKSDLVAKRALVKNGNARIAAATTKLDADIAAGTLNDDQIKEKRASISRVQTMVDKLDASLNKGKEVYDSKEAVLMDMTKN